ncbi:MAG: 3-deoxy-D-manno-octulosonic acid transferase [Prevotella sp.]|nr:3-deoxy-D-manno-octulosonic acid transferase [Prevotella sp.]
MYQLAIYVYLIGVVIYSRFNKKVRTMWRGERQAIKILREKMDPEAQYVWFHAASLGEFEQGRPLMEQLRRDHPEYKILLTFFSPSGYEVRKNYPGADIITYLPLDTIRNARRFLRTVRPVMAFFIKYEFWYNYLHILKHRGVPVYSVSSIFRPGQVFFRRYGRNYGHVLKCFTRFFVQNEQSRQLLATIGITNVDVVGDTRFDRVLQIKEQAKDLDIISNFIRAERKVFVVGSSWQPDEDIYIPYFQQHPEWTLIIAPHVVNEERMQQLEQKLSAFHVHRYSQLSEDGVTAPLSREGNEAGALLIDCYGLLSSIYRYADVCYVGGGFGVSIHNTVEAAVWGKPVIFGPNNQKFQEAQELKACEGGFEITDAQSFATLMDRFTSDPDYLRRCSRQAGDYVASRAGATQKVLAATIGSFA